MNRETLDNEPGTSRIDLASVAVCIGIVAVAFVTAVAMVNQYLGQG